MSVHLGPSGRDCSSTSHHWRIPMSEFETIVRERLEQVERRLEVLQAQNIRLVAHNRCLRLAAGLLVLVGGAFVLLSGGEPVQAQAKTKVVEAEQIVLRDSAGKM